MKRVLICGAILLGMALADEAVELKPQGVAAIQFKSKVMDLDQPINLALAAKDQFCVVKGQVQVVRSRETHKLTQGECFQLPAPRSLGQSVVQFIQTTFAQPRSATPTSMQSRGGECEKAPAIYLPRDFKLPELLIPASGRPNPKALKLLDLSGKTVYSLESRDDRAIFVVPASELGKASRMQILNSRGDILYVGDIFRVDFAEALPSDPRELASALLATGLTDYAHAAYSYLIKAQAIDEAKVLEDQIRIAFACGS